MKLSHTIHLSQTPGRCRWCGCTELRPCDTPCSWVNPEQTLCSECVPLDLVMHDGAGRRALAEFCQDMQFDAGDRRDSIGRGKRVALKPPRPRRRG